MAADGQARARPEGGRPAQLSRHALGTPLLAIRGASELLVTGAGGPLGAAGRELASTVGQAALRLERLVGPLLAVAERAGGPPPRLRPVDLAALARGLGPGLLGLHGPLRAVADPARLADLLERATTWLGRPLEARVRRAGRGRALLLELQGGEAGPDDAEERALLLGLLGRLARLAGARAAPLGAGRLGIVLRVDRHRSGGSRGADAPDGAPWRDRRDAPVARRLRRGAAGPGAAVPVPARAAGGTVARSGAPRPTAGGGDAAGAAIGAAGRGTGAAPR